MKNLELNRIYNQDCLEGLKNIPDNSVDLVIIDPPYELSVRQGSGILKGQKFLEEIAPISNGIQLDVLDELCRVMKKPNIYIWCSKNQIIKFLNYFQIEKGCDMELITWHKSNPIPACNNKYLCDTEYLLYFRKGGVPMYGTYDTKKKYYITPLNKKDKTQYGHPTIKPLHIIENLVINSSKPNDVVLDCYMGSGTTAVASMKNGRNFIGFEIEKKYYDAAMKRLSELKSDTAA